MLTISVRDKESGKLIACYDEKTCLWIMEERKKSSRNMFECVGLGVGNWKNIEISFRLGVINGEINKRKRKNNSDY